MDTIRLETASIDLRTTLLESGQCFCWRETPLGLGAAFPGRALFLRPGEDWTGPEEDAAFLRQYLDLDRDYTMLRSEFSPYPAARMAMERYPGLRVLNQPVWETTLSFILSANNNIPRITGLVRALSERYGERVDTAAGPLWAMPGPGALARTDEASLRAQGTGYRAPYILRSARMVAEGFPLEALRDMPYEDARRTLLQLPGVGDKVADCILLFGCGHAEAFPVDVWVERLLGEWFGMRAGTRPGLKRQAMASFGPHGGLMQQYLFHAARMGEDFTTT